MLLFFGAVMGFISLGLSAFIAHGLHLTVSVHQIKSIDIALQNLQINAVLVVAIGGFLHVMRSQSLLIVTLAGYLFLIGTTLFSLSIILSTLFSLPQLLIATPVGGVILLMAWLVLIIASLRLISRQRQS